MLRSMTAYGRSNLSTESGEYVCELRSVNHRYLDVSLRLPDSLRSLEPVIREILTKALHRGKVDVSLKLTQSASTQESFTLNEDLLAQLTKAADKVKSLSSSTADIDPLRLLQWPGVLTTSVDSQESLKKDALAVFELGVVDFVETRAREGSQISLLLQDRISSIGCIVNEIRQLVPPGLEKHREKLIMKLDQLAIDYDQTRLEQELIYSAQRSDITEELDRIDAHCSELLKVLVRTDSVGRRMDFLMQEFHREANTVNSKSADLGISSAALEIKVLIEQMREQVQNIE